MTPKYPIVTATPKSPITIASQVAGGPTRSDKLSHLRELMRYVRREIIDRSGHKQPTIVILVPPPVYATLTLGVTTDTCIKIGENITLMAGIQAGDDNHVGAPSPARSSQAD